MGEGTLGNAFSKPLPAATSSFQGPSQRRAGHKAPIVSCLLFLRAALQQGLAEALAGQGGEQSPAGPARDQQPLFVCP